MSGLFRAVTPRSFPVKLGDLTFHATGWKLSCVRQYAQQNGVQGSCYVTNSGARTKQLDRKSTRLNSSHTQKSRMPSSA